MRLLVLASLTLLFACGGTPVAQSCSTDADCGEFSCLRDKVSQTVDNMSMCVDSPLGTTGICSPACTTHADCRKYDSSFSCALAQSDAACNPTGICKQNYKITCSNRTCREAPET